VDSERGDDAHADRYRDAHADQQPHSNPDGGTTDGDDDGHADFHPQADGDIHAASNSNQRSGNADIAATYFDAAASQPYTTAADRYGCSRRGLSRNGHPGSAVAHSYVGSAAVTHGHVGAAIAHFDPCSANCNT